MASNNWGASQFALGLAVRAAVIGLLAVAVFELVFQWRLYATALVVAGVAAVVGVDLARRVGAADRMLEVFLGGIAAGAAERPAATVAGFPALSEAMRRAADSINADRLAQQRRIDALEALLDTVTAALIVVSPRGTIALANRAARAFAGEAVDRLEDMAVLGPEAAAQMAGLEPGGRAIVRLADGRRMLAFASQFFALGGERRRLISLQSLSGELDVVEQQAWRDLVRILAHEMMNSLTPISSLAESLSGLLRPGAAKGAADAQVRAREAAEAVEVIARRSTGLMSFVERYRRMADLPTPQPTPIALAAFISDIDRLMAPTLKERGVAYASRVEPPGLTVTADADLLEQALINLIKNAADAVEGLSEPRVTLTCGRQEDQVVIRVADQGRGLPEEDPERVFVPFFTTKPTGSGIGLSLARQIALAHQGRLTVERNHPRGAVFAFSLPTTDTP
jgi:two-component system nitrogen regulation sensor histidine kinase NtrY